MVVYCNDILVDAKNIKNRIIWKDADNNFLLNLQAKALSDVICMSTDALEYELSYGGFRKETVDTYMTYNLKNEISQRMTDRRDKLYNAVKFIIENLGEPFIFYQSTDRKRVIEEASNIFKISRSSLYSLLPEFYKGCKLKDSLLPKYFLSGNRKNRCDYINPPGRKSESRINYFLQKQDFEYFDDIINSFIDDPYRKISISKCYDALICRHYSTIFDGALVEASSKPSLYQFEYYFKKHDKVKAFIKKMGRRAFELKERPLTSSTVNHIEGAGFRYEVDSTTLDINIVNTLSFEYIGPVQLYLGVCSYSKEIGGFALEVDGESINGYKQLLYNCNCDKVEFAEKYGFKIKESDWPAKGLPGVVISDRGKMAQPILEDMIREINISDEITSPGRGDLKPNVERTLQYFNDDLKAFLPGAKVHMIGRCQPDDRKKAAITFDELTKSVIAMIVDYNSRIIEEYPASTEMYRDKINFTPNDIWTWSLKTQSGNMNIFPNNQLIKRLLKTTSKAVSRRGIIFHNVCYVNQKMISNNWLSEVALGKKIKVTIAYDSNDMSYIYIWDKETDEYIRCDMSPKDKERFGFLVTEKDLISAEMQVKQQKKAQPMHTTLQKLKVFDEIEEKAKSRNLPTQDFKNVEEERKDEDKRQKIDDALLKKMNNEQASQADSIENPQKNSKSDNNGFWSSFEW